MSALRHEQEVLAKICRDYSYAWQSENEHDMALTSGMLIGQLARIYRLSPPGGLVDMEALFTVLGLQLLGIEPNADSVHDQLMQANERLDLDTRTRILERIGELPPKRPLRDDDPAE